jgi:hypothetical protein
MWFENLRAADEQEDVVHSFYKKHFWSAAAIGQRPWQASEGPQTAFEKARQGRHWRIVSASTRTWVLPDQVN